MKYLTITLILLAITATACKKSKSQYCYWTADRPGNNDYIWEYTKPSADQVQNFKDTCGCTFTLTETCLPCKPRTDSSGNDFGCE